MIEFNLSYVSNRKRDGRNWILSAESSSGLGYEQQAKFLTKPTGKLLRKHKQRLAKDVAFAKYWDEI